MILKRLITLFAAALLSTAAFAGGDKDKSKSADQKFEQLDSNKDQQLSKSEAAEDAMLSATFASVDKDADGYVSEREYTAHMDDTDRSRQESSDPY